MLSNIEYPLTVNIDYTWVDINGNTISDNCITFARETVDGMYYIGMNYVNTSNGVTTNVYSFENSFGFDNGWSDDVYKIHTITEDTEVDDTFGTWYIANTNYNEVNKSSLVTIEYNGSTIAQLNAGETATLPCKDLAMVSDVVVKVAEKIDGAIITSDGQYFIVKESE